MIALSFQNISTSIRFRLSEWGCSGAMAAWGWILIQPYPTMDKSPGFAVMRHWAYEETWGWTALLLGVLSIAVMVYNGRWRHFPEARMVMAFLRSFLWASIAWGLIRANLYTTGIAAYGAFLIMDFYIIYSASHDAAVERKARQDGA